MILSLYRLIHWLDRKAPIEKRYFRVAIFGSSRIQESDATYAEVRELARRLSYHGMRHRHRRRTGIDARRQRRRAAWRLPPQDPLVRLTILLPMEEQPNPFLDEVAHHTTFFSRLHQFIRLSHAYIVVDGGIGTTLEAMMVWQLLQVRMLRDRTLIFVGPMWHGLRSWIEAEIIGHGLASPADLDIAVWVDDLEQALAAVESARNDFLRRHKVILPPVMDGPPEAVDRGR